MIHFVRRFGTNTTNEHGGYGEMVITAVCGTASTGSIPVSHPNKKPPILGGFLFAKRSGATFQYKYVKW